MDESMVPAHPVVEIEVSGDAVTVDGVVVDRGSAGGPDTTVAMHLGVHAAARQVAQPLGRPVRAVLRCEGDEKRLVIHPDGSVTDVEDTFPVISSLEAPAGSRGAPAARQARHQTLVAQRRRRARLAVGVAYAAVGTVLAGGIIVELAKSDEAPPTSIGDEDLRTQPPVEDEPVPPSVQAIIEGNRVERLPGIADVVANSNSDGFQLRLRTARAAQLMVRATAVSGDDGEWWWSIGTDKATTRTLAIDDLSAGTYRWVVSSPGERPVTGTVVVSSPEPPAVVPVDTTTDTDTTPTPDNTSPPPSNDGGGDAGSGNDDSELPGPTAPVDPDEPNAR